MGSRSRGETIVSMTVLIQMKEDNAHVTILEELSDTRSRVGLTDLGSLLGVEPD